MRAIRYLAAAAIMVLTAPLQAQTWPAVDAALEPLVEQGQLSGVVSIVVKDGKTVHASAIGKRDMESGAPMEMDTVFRAFSMTKPVTAVAMMVLHDEGKWRPSDPIARFLPELADLQVFKGMDADGKPILEAPAAPPTMGQLMTHTAGFSYGFMPGYVDDLYRANSPGGADSLDGFLSRLAALPLAYEPGTQWQYSVAMDVQGAIIERITGQTVQQFMAERIFVPLRMVDTGFTVPAAKRARFAALYGWQDGALARLDGGMFGSAYEEEPGFASAGGGLVTTAGDYARFAQMLLEDGALDGVRVLKPGSAKVIMTDHLPPALVNGKFGIGMQQIRPGYQFGYNGVVVTDPEAAGVDMGKGSYLWDGAAGTWFWADPSNNLVFVGMIQRIMSTGSMPNVQAISQKAVKESLGG